MRTNSHLLGSPDKHLCINKQKEEVDMRNRIFTIFFKTVHSIASEVSKQITINLEIILLAHRPF